MGASACPDPTAMALALMLRSRGSAGRLCNSYDVGNRVECADFVKMHIAVG